MKSSVVIGWYVCMANPAYVQSAVNEYTTSPGGATSDTQVVLNGVTNGNTVVLVLVGIATVTGLYFFNPGSLGEGNRDSNDAIIFNDCFMPGNNNTTLGNLIGNVTPSTLAYGNPGTDYVTTAMFYATKVPGGNYTIYPTFDTPASGTWSVGVYAFEISGTSVFDAGDAAVGVGTSASTGVFTSNNPNDLIISVAFNQAKVAPTSESYTLIQNTATLGACLQYTTGAAAGSQTATATYAASQDWCITAGAFGNPTPGPPYIVQYTTGAGEGYQSTNTQNSFLNNVTKGNLIIAMLGFYGETGEQIITSTSISDTAGNVWRDTGLRAVSSIDNGIYAHMWYAIANKSGLTTATVTPLPSSIGGSGVLGLYLFEINGANAFDNGSSYVNNNQGSSFIYTSGSFYTGYSNEIQIGYAALGSANLDAPGWTQLDTTPAAAITLYVGNNSTTIGNTAITSMNSQVSGIQSIFCVVPSSAGTPPSIVQSSTNSIGSATSISTTIASAQTSGNLNIVFVAWDSATGSLTGVPTDGSNTYTLFGSLQAPYNASMFMYYCASIRSSGAGRVVTANFSGTVSFPEIKVIEIAGAAASPIDTPTVVLTGYSSAGVMSAGPITPANANELSIGYNQNQGTSAGPGPRWSAITGVGVGSNGVNAISGYSAQFYSSAITSQRLDVVEPDGSAYGKLIVLAGAFYYAPYLPNDPIFFGIT